MNALQLQLSRATADAYHPAVSSGELLPARAPHLLRSQYKGSAKLERRSPFAQGLAALQAAMKKLYIARPAVPPPTQPEPQPEPMQQEEDIALLRQGSITDPERVGELLDRLTLDEQGRRGNAVSLAFMVKDHGVSLLKEKAVLERLVAAAEDKKSPLAREGAMMAIGQIANTVGASAEPFMLPLLSLVLEGQQDKAETVRKAAVTAARNILEQLHPRVVTLVLPDLLAGLEMARNWQVKEGCLKLLETLCDQAPAQISASLDTIVPAVSDCMADARQQVAKAAWSTQQKVFTLQGNRDIEACVPDILACMARPGLVPDTITKLSATTFVQEVASPALSVMVPVLVRGLACETVIKRRTCMIIANMAKLVNDPAQALPFLPKLLPGLEVAKEQVADPECRSVANMAYNTLLRVSKETDEAQHDRALVEKNSNVQVLLPYLQEALQVHAPGKPPVDAASMAHVMRLCAMLVHAKVYDLEQWRPCTVPYLTPVVGEHAAEQAVAAFLARAVKDTAEEEVESDDDGEGEELCNCTFSLAYGGKILLNNARLHLRRGRRYGLCGHNGAGKSTLMRAIAKGQLDGFPSPEELRTVYVEHDVQASQSELSIVDFCLDDAKVAALSTRDGVVKVLASVGFDDVMQARQVGMISGGWKMKLALARAMLQRADILLLDEPTNHLDANNVAWLEHYLTTQSNITCMVVSHDSAFLDNVTTDIIHYETRKLRHYKGNLAEFVERKPEAKAYYQLAAVSLKFNFPEPGFLDGVTSKEKPIVKLTKVTFTYPGAEKPQLMDVSVQCSLGSRIAVLGVNGAGKSTLIKVLCGELRPQKGIVYKHPNLRLAYVAQHAFHHLEQHLETTPLKYLRDRYYAGEDKEETHKVGRKMSAEEEAALRKQVWVIDGQNRVLDRIVGRRKKKKGFEYEVAWVGLSSLKFNRWIPREVLVERGFEKLVNKYDGELAATALGADTRPLTGPVIEAYLADFGLEAEFAVHSRIRGLSGGQKVKLVLAAAMWSNPQLLVLDEPTNYLDREALGALADAIKAFNGGVVIISHHHEFTSALCNTTWRVADGKVTVRVGADGTSVDAGEDGADKVKPTAANPTGIAVAADAR